MKKFFKFAAIAFAALAMVSCDDKDGNKGNNDDNGDDVAGRKVLLALASKVDEEGNFLKGWKFFYNEDGKLAEMRELAEDGSIEWQLKYTWNGNTVSVNEVWEGDEGPEEGLWCTYTVGANGYFTQCVKGSSTYTYEYDAEGHLIKIYEDWGEGNTLVSNVTWENGNMTSWSKEGEYTDDENTSEEDEVLKIKQQTYKTDLNVTGIFTAYPEKGNIKRWMMELGMFGKPSKNHVNVDKWNYYTTADQATFEYRTDDDDYVVAEVKYWDGAIDTETYFIWQAAE